MNYLLDLENNINNLQDRWNDLRAISAHPPGPSPAEKTQQRREIADQMKQIEIEISALRDIWNNKNASQVVIPNPSPAEVAELTKAEQDLSKVIQQQQAFDEILQQVTTVLNAAGTVINEANKGA